MDRNGDKANFADGSAAALRAFHTRHKLVLMAQSPSQLRQLGNIVATLHARPLPESIAQYGAIFLQAMQQPARPARVVNALQHAFGYVSPALNAYERAHFLAQLDGYVGGRVSIDVPMALLKSWIERFDVRYLAGQAFFER